LIEIKNSYSYFDNIIVKVFNKFGKKVPPVNKRDQLWRNVDYKTLLKSWNFPDHDLFWKTFDDIDFIGRQLLLQKGSIKLYNDVIPYFLKSRGSKKRLSIIITNTTQQIAEFILNHFDLVKYFYSIYGLGETQELCKPSPGGINSILNDLSKHYNFKKSDVYIIGDSENDIIAGKKAGIRTIYLNRKNLKIESKSDFFINTLDELFQVVNKDEKK